MASVTVESSGSSRRRLDSEVAMIPLIDLLVCCISFLLLTAVWTSWSRLPTDAQVPSQPQETPAAQERALHVDLTTDSYKLSWRESGTLLRNAEVPRPATAGASPSSLAEAVTREWNEYGLHKNHDDPRADRAVVHCPDRATFEECTAVMDAVLHTKRPFGASPDGLQSAFAIALAKD